MARHEDINVPKISIKKTIVKILTVLLIPILIIVVPLFYDQGVGLENILTAVVVLFILAYTIFFIF